MVRHVGITVWYPILAPSGVAVLRARVIDGGVAFAVSLRDDAGTEATPHVVAAALASADGSLLALSGDALLDREEELASRVAAQL